MKRFLLLLALFAGTSLFSQTLVVNNTSPCTQFVEVFWMDPTCATAPGSPTGIIAIPPGGMQNFAGPAGYTIGYVRIMESPTPPPPGCFDVKVHGLTPPACSVGPINASAPNCTCGMMINAMMSGTPANQILTIFP
jgi:hypothetical protein